MTNVRRYILASVMTVSAMAGLQAQTYNDTVRTHTWTVFARGGLSKYWQMRGGDWDASRRPVTPDAAVGVDYNIRPWVRVGLKAEYTILKSTSRVIRMGTTSQDGYKVGDYTTTLNTTIDRLQNRNNMSVAMADLHADFNIMDIWHHRKAQKFNLWIGTGVGYWHGWNRNSQTLSYAEEAVAKGDTYFNVYTHNYMKSTHDFDRTDALYIPLSLQAEYDITPRWTAGVYVEGKYLPLNKELTPKWVGMAGVKLAYNFVGKKMKTYKSLYEEALAREEVLKRCCAEKDGALAQLAQQQEANSRLQNELADAKKENRKLADQLRDENGNAISGHVVYFPLDKYQLTSSEKIRLDQYIAKARKSNTSLVLLGEASKDGSSAHNQALSEKRLYTVLGYLAGKGIKDARISQKKAIGSQNKGDETFRRVVITEEQQ